jgi:hypothetical protein
MNDEPTIEKLLQNTKTIAVVGLSSNPGKAGHYVPAYLQKQGYRIFPVNPYLDEALGEKAYDQLSDIPDPIDLVLLFQRSVNVPPFVEAAIACQAKAIWMQTGITHERAAAQARTAGLDVVQDACMLVEHRRWTNS